MRSPFRPRPLIAALAVAVAAVLAPGVAAADTALTGTTGPGFTISLVDAAGAPVTKLDPGTYVITVRDRSDFHNFRLSGPGVDRFTELEFVGEVTWTVTLGEGRYSFICDPHSSSMIGNFNVGNVPPPAAATTTAATATTTAPKPAAKPAAKPTATRAAKKPAAKLGTTKAAKKSPVKPAAATAKKPASK